MAITDLQFANSFSMVSGLSASKFPFLVKYNPSSETPKSLEVSSLITSSKLSPLTPKKKPKLAKDCSAAIRYFSFKISMLNTFGDVLGISIKEVTPPASAALLSVYKSPLWVSPGSRK